MAGWQRQDLEDSDLHEVPPLGIDLWTGHM